jgi:hypothetical protein
MAELTTDELNDLLMVLASKDFQAYEDRVRQLPDAQGEAVQRFLGARDGGDFDLLGLYMEWRDINQFAASYRLLPALGNSKAMLAERTAGLVRLTDLADEIERHFLGGAITKLFATTPGLALDVRSLVRSPTPPSNAVGRMWAAAFANAAPGAASQHALDLIATDPDAALDLLKVLSWKSVEVRTVLEPQKDRALAILSDAVDRGVSDAWDALAEQAGFDESAQRIVMAGLDKSVAAAAGAVCRLIAGTQDAFFGFDRTPLDRILGRLVRVGLTDAAARPYVNIALTHCLHSESLAPLAVDALAALNTQGVVEHFEMAFGALARQEKLFATVMTAWLLSPEVSFVAIRELCHLIAAGQAPGSLDEPMFQAASAEARVKAIRRLLGTVHDGQTLCSFAACVARMPTLGNAGLKMAAEMFNVIFNEYPNATERFLLPLTAPALKKERGADIFNGVHAGAVQWRKLLEGLPRRPELEISDADFFAFQGVRRKMQLQINREVEKRSVFAPITQKQRAAQGRRFASHGFDGQVVIGEMTSYSHSLDLPTSEIADPMRGLLSSASYRENSK